MTRIALLAAVLVLGACSTYQPAPTMPANPCPPLVAYSPEEQARGADEYDALPSDSVVKRMVSDYAQMRAMCRAGSSAVSPLY